MSEVPGVEVFAEEQPAAARVAGRETDRFSTDIPILIVAALLAGITFLEWYEGPRGFGISVSGWQSGNWGPIILFLAAGSVLLVALRRLGVHVGLPVEESLLHEGSGWVSLVGAVLKSRLRPGPDGLLTTSYGVYVAIGAAVVLIVLAGRMQPHAPLVVRPGWYRARAGVIGIGAIVAVVAGSAVFGTINSASLQPSGDGDLLSGTVRGRLPDCAKEFPMPPGLKPQYGFGSGPACQAQLTSTSSSQQVSNAFRALLKSRSYVFSEIAAGAPGSIIFTITKPRCATLAIVPEESGSIVAVALTPCVAQTGSPRASPRPS